MNSLQIELDSINQQLELLTYRKAQLDSIIAEYSDVINRVKSLIDSMQDANVEPSNLLIEIEGLIHCPEPEPVAPEPEPELTPDHEKINSYIIPFDPLIHGEPEPELTPFSLPAPEQPTEPDDDNDEEDELEQFVSSDEIAEAEAKSPYFPPMTYWDHKKSVRLFISRKRRSKGELQAIIADCIGQGLAERYELNQCGDDWIVAFSPVLEEEKVHQIIIRFYPQYTEPTPTPTPEPTPKSSNPELIKLMALVPTATVPTPTPKTQLNERAWRRGDTLLIGFTNKKLMNQWMKWAKESWEDRVKIDNLDQLEGFDYCLSILWHSRADWERLKALDYSLKPDEQTPIKTDDFEYKQATEKTTQIFRDGVLLGLAINCDLHWESPQFKDEKFESCETVAVKLWELINNF